MIFNNVLNHIFSSASNVSILRVLMFVKNGLTGREIGRNAGVSPKTALRVLTELENLKIVNRTIGGRDHLFVLNREKYLVERGIIPLLETEQLFLKSILAEIKRKLKNKCISIILFGSVARKDEIATSDLDVCLIVKNKTILKEVEKIKLNLFNKILEKYGVTLAFIIFTENEIKKYAKDKIPLVKNMIEEGTLIFGKPIVLILYGKKKQTKNN